MGNWDPPPEPEDRFGSNSEVLKLIPFAVVALSKGCLGVWPSKVITHLYRTFPPSGTRPVDESPGEPLTNLANPWCLPPRKRRGTRRSRRVGLVRGAEFRLHQPGASDGAGRAEGLGASGWLQVDPRRRFTVVWMKFFFERFWVFFGSVRFLGVGSKATSMLQAYQGVGRIIET